VVRTVVWTIASISAAGGPHPSASPAPRLVPVPAKVVAMRCAGECPTNTDRLELLAKLGTGIYSSSTSTTGLVIGT
jgi:hypothetical protein